MAAVDHHVGKPRHSWLALGDQRGAQLAGREVSVEAVVGDDEMIAVAAREFECDPWCGVGKTGRQSEVIVPEHAVNVVVR